jgi:hypothetical protein
LLSHDAQKGWLLNVPPAAAVNSSVLLHSIDEDWASNVGCCVDYMHPGEDGLHSFLEEAYQDSSYPF